jgi:hypothetical protein
MKKFDFWYQKIYMIVWYDMISGVKNRFSGVKKWYFDIKQIFLWIKTNVE